MVKDKASRRALREANEVMLRSSEGKACRDGGQLPLDNLVLMAVVVLIVVYGLR